MGLFTLDSCVSACCSSGIGLCEFVGCMLLNSIVCVVGNFGQVLGSRIASVYGSLWLRL